MIDGLRGRVTLAYKSDWDTPTDASNQDVNTPTDASNQDVISDNFLAKNGIFGQGI